MADFETVIVKTDLLILGGGMAACGAAVEAAHWAMQNGLKVTLVDKAAVDRSGAVAMGLSAINQYVGLKDGANTIKDYVDYVRNDLMGVTREDLVADIARHVDSSVHLFEKWGLPIWKDAEGKYVHEGRWQLMINGESYKVVVAEAAKNALLQTGVGEIYERIFIVGPIMDGERCAGAVGFSVRENKFYVFESKATLVAMGGAVHVFKPRSSGEGMGRAWYPPWNAGSSAYFTLKAGAEMTCQEVRFIPVRFKDAYGPVGAWFLLFKSQATNAQGGNYMIERKPELEKWGPYGRVKPIPANLRNYMGMLDVMEGKGPIYMRTEEAIQKIANAYKDDPKAYKKKMKDLESEAWEDFLDMTISQALLWAATNLQPEERSFGNRRRRAVLHRFALRRFRRLGQRSGGPADRRNPQRIFLGLCQHVDREGTLLRRRRFGRLQPQVLFRFARRRPHRRQVRDQVHRGEQHRAASSMRPHSKPSRRKSWLRSTRSSRTRTPPPIRRSIRITSSPGCSCSACRRSWTNTPAASPRNSPPTRRSSTRALELLAFLKEDSAKLAAANLHELMRCWENVHRMWQAEAHVRTVLFREETRWPGYYFRADKPKLDEENWHVFANCRFDPKTGQLGNDEPADSAHLRIAAEGARNREA